MNISSFVLKKHATIVDPRSEPTIQRRNIVNTQWLLSMMYKSRPLPNMAIFRTNMLELTKAMPPDPTMTMNYIFNTREPSPKLARARSFVRQAVYFLVSHCVSVRNVYIDPPNAELTDLLGELFGPTVVTSSPEQAKIYLCNGQADMAVMSRCTEIMLPFVLDTELAIDAPPGALMLPPFVHTAEPCLFLGVVRPDTGVELTNEIYPTPGIKSTLLSHFLACERDVYQNPTNGLYVPIETSTGEWTCDFATMHAYTTMVRYCRRRQVPVSLALFEKLAKI